MAGIMGGNGQHAGDSDQPNWGDLSPEERAKYINVDVEKIIEESQLSTKEIVEAAMKDFAADYAAIKSQSMRDSVLRNIIEAPLPVDDPENPDSFALGPAELSQLRPPVDSDVVKYGRSRVMSFFLHLFGF